MTKKEILDYVMENPGNTNVSVLGPMVDAVAGVAPTGKITITENGSDIDVAQYAKADVDVKNEPVLIAQSLTGLSGFTDEMIEAITKVSGCVKIEVLASIPGHGVRVTTFTKATTIHNGYVTGVIFPATISSGMESATLVLEFEEDKGDPESPVYSARLADAATNMGGSWADVSSMLTILEVTIYSVEVEE